LTKYWQDRYNKQGHSHYCASWNISDSDYDKMIEKRKQFFLDWTDNQEFKNVLDFGCGNGYMSDLFSSHYLGVDIIPELIDNNKIKYDKVFETVDNYLGWKNPVESYDLVLCLSSLQYLSTQKLNMWLSMLRKETENLIIQDSTNKKDGHTYYRPHEELKKLCIDAGFKVHKEIPEGSRWLWLK